MVRGALLIGLLLAASLAGCGDDDRASDAETTATATLETTTSRESGPPPAAPEVECPPGLADCVTAGGEILYVERVDPDGDGDAHFVLLSAEGITAPGISVIDVRADLRPHPLPGPGDLLSAAGPVFEGSLGQRQIQAEVVEVHLMKNGSDM